VSCWVTAIVGADAEIEGRAPVVMEFGSESSHMKILPVSCQLLPVISDNVAISFAPETVSFNPETFIVKVCVLPSQRRGRKGEISISYSFKSKASIPTIGLQKAGTTPPVKMIENGHCTPASIPSMNT